MQQNEMYKHALCREDSSGYGSIFLAGLVYRFEDNGALVKAYDHHGAYMNFPSEIWAERFHPLVHIAAPAGLCGDDAADYQQAITASQPSRPDAAAMAKRSAEKKAEDLPDTVWEIIRSTPEDRTSVFIGRGTLNSASNHDVLMASRLFKSLGYEVTIRYDDYNLIMPIGLRLSWAHLVDK